MENQEKIETVSEELNLRSLSRFVLQNDVDTYPFACLHPTLNKTLYVAIDLETTSLDDFYGRICEVGMTVFSEFQIIGIYAKDVIVNDPEAVIDPSALAVNGFTHERLSKGELIEDLLEAMYMVIQTLTKKGAFERTLLVFQNAPFDVAFLKRALSRIVKKHGPSIWTDFWNKHLRRVLDTVSLGYMAHLDQTNDLQSLSALCTSFKVDVNTMIGKKHSAGPDSLKCAVITQNALRIQEKLHFAMNDYQDRKYD